MHGVGAEASFVDARLRENCRRYAAGVGVFTSLAAIGVLFGWALDIPTLTRLSPNPTTMKANTAVGSVAAGIAVVALNRRSGQPSAVVIVACCLTMGMIGGLTLIEYLAGVNLGIDQLLFVDADGGRFPGRPSPATAGAFAALAAAIVAVLRRRAVWGQALASVAFAVATLALLGYAFDVRQFYTVGRFTSMAVHTSALLAVLSVAVALSAPDRGFLSFLVARTPGGQLGRQLLPAAMLGPPTVGYLRWQGERAGLYDSAFGLALMVIAMMTGAMFVVIRSARSLRAATAVAEASSDALIVADADHRVRTWNRAAQELFGYTAAEVLGRSAEIVVPEDQRTPEAALLDRALRGERIAALETQRRRRDGTIFDAEIAIAPVLEEHGPTRSVAIVTRDISERVGAARALRDALARETAASERLRELDQLKTEFVAVVAHDLRSPMGVIRGFVDLLEYPSSEEERGAHLAVIRRVITQLDDLIEDVLEVSRIESGVIAPKRAPFDVALLVATISDDLRMLYPDRQIAVQIDGGATIAEADERLTTRILTNLLSNALKYSDDDVRTLVRVADGEVIVEVHDRGPGIAQEDTARLFQRFSRLVHPDAKTRPKGTGLGLYISKSIAELQGGRIWVESEPGRGSTFAFALPAAIADAGEVSP